MTVAIICHFRPKTCKNFNCLQTETTLTAYVLRHTQEDSSEDYSDPRHCISNRHPVLFLFRKCFIPVFVVYGQMPPDQLPPGQMPRFFATPVKSPLDKTPPVKRPLRSNDHSSKWQREHVQCVLCYYCYRYRSDVFFKQEFVRPRWPYDMRPSPQCVPKSTCVSL